MATDDAVLRGRGRVLAAGANPLVLINRVAFVAGRGLFDEKAEALVLRWAEDHDLGQDLELLRIAAARRERALAWMADAGSRWARLTVTPQWRMAVGLGNRTNPYEIGMSLHGTYGWPVIPGSTIKGLTSAWAQTCGADQQEPRFDAIFGLPRVGAATGRSAGPAEQGSVRFLDALPIGGPVRVTRDVVTPHVQPYYQGGGVAPAEYHNPVPSEFLVVEGGRFAVDLVGPAEDVRLSVTWCAEAFDELGIGGKTAAGYGYLTVAPPERFQGRGPES